MLRPEAARIGADALRTTPGVWFVRGEGTALPEARMVPIDPPPPEFTVGQKAALLAGLGSINSNCSTDLDVSAAPCSTKVQRYRVTVYSRAPNGAEVILQSAYEVP